MSGEAFEALGKLIHIGETGNSYGNAGVGHLFGGDFEKSVSHEFESSVEKLAVDAFEGGEIGNGRGFRMGGNGCAEGLGEGIAIAGNEPARTVGAGDQIEGFAESSGLGHH